MRTVTITADNRRHAEQLLRDYDCPAVAAFIEDYDVAGSCRFIGIDPAGTEVSVLIISATRPAAFARDTSDT